MLCGIANFLSLGMCFLCGVFVPMNVMDRNVLKVSQFLPVYWYETVNETLGSYSHLTGEAAASVWKGIGLEAMFAIAFVCMILVVTRYQRQKYTEVTEEDQSQFSSGYFIFHSLRR